MKEVIWLVIANSIETLVYELKSKESLFIKHLKHESSRLKTRDLISDKPGKYKTAQSIQEHFDPAVDSHKKEKEQFAREIANFLDKANKNHEYNGIILCAEPQFYGLIEKLLPKAVHRLIKKSIQKDYIPLPKSKREELIQKIIYENLSHLL